MRDANTEEKSLIEAQLRLIHWLVHLKKEGFNYQLLKAT